MQGGKMVMWGNFVGGWLGHWRSCKMRMRRWGLLGAWVESLLRCCWWVCFVYGISSAHGGLWCVKDVCIHTTCSALDVSKHLFPYYRLQPDSSFWHCRSHVLRLFFQFDHHPILLFLHRLHNLAMQYFSTNISSLFLLPQFLTIQPRTLSLNLLPNSNAQSMVHKPNWQLNSSSTSPSTLYVPSLSLPSSPPPPCLFFHTRFPTSQYQVPRVPSNISHSRSPLSPA